MELDNEAIRAAFNLAWDEFGEEKSTEFLIQITADRLGIEPDDVFNALAAEP
jgi:Flp pilus assembly protein TadB